MELFIFRLGQNLVILVIHRGRLGYEPENVGSNDWVHEMNDTTEQEPKGQPHAASQIKRGDAYASMLARLLDFLSKKFDVLPKPFQILAYFVLLLLFFWGTVRVLGGAYVVNGTVYRQSDPVHHADSLIPASRYIVVYDRRPFIVDQNGTVSLAMSAETVLMRNFAPIHLQINEPDHLNGDSHDLSTEQQAHVCNTTISFLTFNDIKIPKDCSQEPKDSGAKADEHSTLIPDSLVSSAYAKEEMEPILIGYGQKCHRARLHSIKSDEPKSASSHQIILKDRKGQLPIIASPGEFGEKIISVAPGYEITFSADYEFTTCEPGIKLFQNQVDGAAQTSNRIVEFYVPFGAPGQIVSVSDLTKPFTYQFEWLPAYNITILDHTEAPLVLGDSDTWLEEQGFLVNRQAVLTSNQPINIMLIGKLVDWRAAQFLFKLLQNAKAPITAILYHVDYGTGNPFELKVGYASRAPSDLVNPKLSEKILSAKNEQEFDAAMSTMRLNINGDKQ